MKKYILVNYFRDTNEERKKEYLFCIQKNLTLKFINKIIIFIENEEHKNDLKFLLNSSKIIYVKINKRLEFKEAIFYSEKFLPNSIVIFLNLDIFLANIAAWKNIDENFFKKGSQDKALVCYRNNLFSELLPKNLILIEKKSFLEGDCCDAWIFQTPFNPKFLKKNFNFCIGNAPGCDGLMMGLINSSYHLYSWGKKYKIFHYDICRKLDYNKKKYNFYNNGYILNHKADIRPTLRFKEWIRVPVNQNWTYFLKNQKKPEFIYTYKYNKFFFMLKFIYSFFIFRFNQFISILRNFCFN